MVIPYVKGYLDESGSLSSLEENFVVAIFINPKNEPLDRIIRKIRRKIPKKRAKKEERIKELKFSNSSEKTRKKILSAIAKKSIDIFVLVLDKTKRRIKDNPENYGKIVNSLLEDCFNFYPKIEVCLDIHFTNLHERHALEQILQKESKLHLGVDLRIKMEDSEKNKFLQIADFLAGAFYHKYTRRDDNYTTLIKEKVKVEKFIQWV